MMNALTQPPFPTNPSVGERFGNWVWNGARWVCSKSSGTRVIATVFTASGPYMPSPGLVSLTVECIGGGGGGGGAVASWTGSGLGWVTGGGGGQAGGYARKTLDAALVLGGVNVTIGTFGLGGVGAAAGAAGTDTSFGALCLAKGGAGGNGSNVGSGNTMLGEGGASFDSGIGDIAWRGNCGQPGTAFYLDPGLAGGTVAGGAGGGSLFGGSTPAEVMFAPNGSITGATAVDGAGGSGGAAATVATPATGGQGGAGMCIVTEYCWADMGDEDCFDSNLNVNARVAVTHVPWTGPGPCPPGWQQVAGPHGGFDD